MTDDHPLRGRIGVVTGAASGFGRALAEECARAGMSVALLDIDRDRATDSAKSLADEYDVETMAGKVDVGVARDVDEAVSNLGLTAMTDDELAAIIDGVVERNRAVVREKGDRAFSALMGEVMKLARGKADGQKVSRLLRRAIDAVGKA